MLVPPVRRIARRAAFALATSDRLERVALVSSESRHLVFARARRYVAGLDEQAAFAVVGELRADGLAASVDLFGENTGDGMYAEAVTERYLALAAMLGAHPDTYLSLDCSHLGLDGDARACRARIERIARALPAGARLQLGAEESSRTDAVLGIAQATVGAGLPVMVTVQANLRRSAQDIDDLAAAHVPIRLVKGAYVESRSIAHPWGEPTDTAYVALADRLAELGADHALATHDPGILERLLAGRPGASVEFLLGVRPDEARRLAGAGYRIRIYVPFGRRWFRYYARRAAESIGA
jgi:proline dehydrogenase